MFKNVFVLCTGRCGSTTFAKACQHFTNYTAGHETRTGLVGAARLAYPANHIEVDNRLSWLLGRLEKSHGDSAFYVHLKRDPVATAASFAKRTGGIMAAYQGKGILMNCKEKDPELVASDYVNTVTSNIELFLATKTNKMTVDLENSQQDFGQFAQAISAEGDITAALKVFDTHHNASSVT